MKKQKETTVDRMETINATLEWIGWNARALHVRVVGLKKEAHKKMPRISEQRLGHQIFHLLQRERGKR